MGVKVYEKIYKLVLKIVFVTNSCSCVRKEDGYVLYIRLVARGADVCKKWLVDEEIGFFISSHVMTHPNMEG